MTDLPEPVAPATRTWGIFAKFAKWSFPDIPFPSVTSSGLSDFWNSSEPISEARPTVDLTEFGISIPTSDFPGIGASILSG